MTRLAAKQRVLFYPTPLEIVGLVAGNIVCGVNNSPDERWGSILDPCCGIGQPLALMANHLGLLSYGNELHPERYAQARDRLDYCLNGAREFLSIEGRFNVLWNNPPYDREFAGQRMEISHIEWLTTAMRLCWALLRQVTDASMANGGRYKVDLVPPAIHQVTTRVRFMAAPMAKS